MTHLLLSTRDVARELHKSERTVHRLVASGKLKPVAKAPGPNGAFLFSPDDVEALRQESDES